MRHHLAVLTRLFALISLPWVLGCPFSGARFVADPHRDQGLPKDPAELVREADRLIGHKLSERAPELDTTDRAMAALERAMKEGQAQPFEVLWRLSKACFLMTEGVENTSQRKVYAERGMTYAQQARRIAGKRVEPYYYLALNTAKLAESTSDMNLVRSMVVTMQTAARIDARYDDAGPLRFLGKVYITAPAWPVSVGSPEKAIEVLERAVAIAPVPLNVIFLGQAYFHDEEYEEAERHLKRALQDGAVNRLPRRWLKEAETYLKRIQRGPATDPRTNL